MTSGNQKCKGAAPIFSNKATLKIINSGNLNCLVIELARFIKITIADRSKEDPKTWVMKYFRAASVGYLLLYVFIRGIKDRRLISKPIQEINHILAEIAMKVPIIIELKNISLKIFIIKKKRIITFISGV